MKKFKEYKNLIFFCLKHNIIENAKNLTEKYVFKYEVNVKNANCMKIVIVKCTKIELEYKNNKKNEGNSSSKNLFEYYSILLHYPCEKDYLVEFILI